PVLSLVGLVLLDAAEHPVEFTAGDLAVTVFADAGHVDLERGAAVGALVVGPAAGLDAAPADEGPVLAEAPRLVTVAADQVARGVYRVIDHAGEDAQCDGVVEGVHNHLHRDNLL